MKDSDHQHASLDAPPDPLTHGRPPAGQAGGAGGGAAGVCIGRHKTDRVMLISQHLMHWSALRQGKLAALAAEQQASASTGTDSFAWRGTSYELPSEAARIALHSAGELTAQLDSAVTDGLPSDGAAAMDTEEGGSGGSGGSGAPRLEQQLASLDKLANAYSTARAAVAQAIASGGFARWRMRD